MVNTNVQGVIPIVGAGFVAKKNGNYLPGEYKRLSNVEIDSDILRSRRSVKSVFGTSPGISTTPMDNPLGFIGSMNNFSLIVSESEQVAVGAGLRLPMWSPTSLPVPAFASSFNKLVGFFRYNNKNYWISIKFDNGTTIKVCLYHGNIDPNNDNPDVYTFAGLTETTIISIPVASLDYNKFDFCNFFIHGERLWITTTVGVYFSKATDPTIFTIPDGGFFKFPDQRTNWAMSLRDSIYVLCDNSINVISYTADPNTDSFVTKISDNLGAEHGCIFRDTPVVVNQIGIYRIANNFLEKMMDNTLDVGEDFYANKIFPFENYVILNKSSKINYEKFDGVTTSVRTNIETNPTFEVDNTGMLGSDNYLARTNSTEQALFGTHSHKTIKLSNPITSRINLIKVPNFNNGLSGSSFWESGALSTSVGIDTAEKFEGSGSLRFDWDPENQPGGAKPPFEVWGGMPISGHIDSIPVVAGHNHHVFLRQRKSLNIDTCVIRLSIAWLGSGDTNVISETTLYTLNSASPEQTWIDINIHNLFAPVGAIAASLHWEKISGGSPQGNFHINVDQVMFEDITAFPENLTINYIDGESVDSVDYSYSWSGTVGKSTSIRTGSIGTLAESIKIFERTTKRPITANKNYTTGVGVFAKDAAHGVNMRIKQHDAGNVLVSESVIDIGDSILNEWKYFETTFTASSNATQFTYSLEIDAALTTGQRYYVDARITELTSTYQGYFDGSFTDTSNVDYAWTGTPNASTSTYTASSILRKLYKNGRNFVPGQAGNTLGYNLYFVNMDNGAIHVMEFTDGRDAAIPGYVIDIIPNPFMDATGNYNCFLLTNRFVSETVNALNYKSNCYYISSFRDYDFVDYACTSDNLLKKYPPKVDVEIDSYVPDGNEYLTKKFRSLEIMGVMPAPGMDVEFGFDNSDYTSPVGLMQFDDGRSHYPSRIGINQRAKSLSVRLIYDLNDVPLLESEPFGSMEISDMRVLWTYTQRAPTSKDFANNLNT